MRCSILVDDELIRYQVIEKGELTEEQLGGMYYYKTGNIYERTYPKNRLMFNHCFEKICSNYNNFIEKELKNERSIKLLENALLWVIENHEKACVKWWIAGSTALFIRGLKVLPHDIDVMTYKTEIEKINSIVSNYIVEPFHHVTNWVVKGFGVVDYNYRIDYAFEPEDWVDNNGYLDFGSYAEMHLEEIEWKGHKIMVPPIELHLKSNIDRKRSNVVNAIQEYIRKNNCL